VSSNVSRRTDGIWFFGKTFTERLGIRFRDIYTRLDPTVGSSRYGWQSLTATAQYEALLDPPHEFLFSVGVDRQFRDTGAGRVQRPGFSGVGATTPSFYFGKGFGDLDIGYLRPLAIAGTFGYLIADKSPRPDVATAGFAIEYSIPYLQSKVRALDVPDPIRSLTPITELFLTTPAGPAHGTPNTALIAPGIAYTGAGWQFGIEAMIPMTRATGRGVGGNGPTSRVARLFLPQQHWQACFLIAVTTRISNGSARPGSAAPLAHAARKWTALPSPLRELMHCVGGTTVGPSQLMGYPVRYECRRLASYIRLSLVPVINRNRML
jgi:hypothetical protein